MDVAKKKKQKTNPRIKITRIKIKNGKKKKLVKGKQHKSLGIETKTRLKKENKKKAIMKDDKEQEKNFN